MKSSENCTSAAHRFAPRPASCKLSHDFTYWNH